MIASLFFYNMKNMKPKIRTKINETLFSRKKKSNYSSYIYENQGILGKDDFIRPVRAVLIVKKEYTKRIVDVFDSYGVNYRLFEIKIPANEFKKSRFFK